MPSQKSKTDLTLKWDFSKVFAGIDGYAAHVQQAGIRAGMDICMDGLGRMVDRAPVLTGHLRGSHSGHINGEFIAAGPPPESGGADPNTGGTSKKKDSLLIVWGANTHYAARRHEIPSPGTHGGEGRWMSATLIENAKKWTAHFASRVYDAGS